MRNFDVIIVGLGAAGAAAAMHLARRGLRVLGLEQFDIPTTLGSSGGITRLIRLCYFEHPDYVPLLHRAYELWRELERDASRRLLFVTGGVYAGRPAGELVAGSLAAARAHGLAHETIDRGELRRRWPQLRVPDDHVALVEPATGFVLCEQAVAAHAELALRSGAELRAQEPMMRWCAEGDGVRVETTRDTYSAARLLLTTGAWTAQAAPALGWPLTPTRQVTAWVWPRRPELFEMQGTGLDAVQLSAATQALPCWAVEHDGGGLHYGFPMSRDGTTGLGLKLGLHRATGPVEPDAVDRTRREGDEATVRSFLSTTLPDADGPLVALRVCLYTNTPDGHFAIDRHPRHEQVVVASPCSGHGFKFAPVVGEALADLVERGATRHPVGFLGARRFGNGGNRS